MRISHEYKFIYFANPKTGSQTVRKVLDACVEGMIEGGPYADRPDGVPWYGHMRPIEAREAFEKLGWDYDSYFKFTCTRNPWSRLVSVYHYAFGKEQPSLIDRVTGAHPSFSSWLRSTSTGGSGGGGHMRWRRYGTYSMMNFAGDGQSLLVDEVLRMEDMNEGLRAILRQLSLPNAETVEIPHANKRDHKPYAQYYDDGLRELVAERYADDIRTYGYSFAGELVGA
jgi:hypothetical protein